MRKRHHLNPSHELIHDDYFQGQHGYYNIMYRQGQPMIRGYLQSLEKTLIQSLIDYRLSFVFRVDLRFPMDMYPHPLIMESNEVLTLFFRYLREEMDRANTCHPTKLRYVWARAQHNSDKPHYHLLLLFNQDAYSSIGSMRPSASGDYDGQNLFHRIVRAWSKAIGWPSFASGGLVQLGRDPMTNAPFSRSLHQSDRIALEDTVYVGSYLCKSFSKVYNQRLHTFGTSRG